MSMELTAVLGVGAAYMAYLSLRRYISISSALRRVSDAPSVSPYGLRSALLPDADGKLIVVRGTIDNNPSSPELIIERARTNLYSGWIGLFGWTKNPPHKMPPLPNFILVDGKRWPYSDYLVVNLEGSNSISNPNHSMLNLQIAPIDYSIGNFFDELFRLKRRRDILLPRGKDVTAVGIGRATTSDGDHAIFEIEPCEDLPYFISNLTRDEMVADLNSATKVLILSGVVFGCVAVGMICYSRWKKWKARLAKKERRSSR